MENLKKEKLMFVKNIDKRGIDGIADINNTKILAICEEPIAKRFIAADQIVRRLAAESIHIKLHQEAIDYVTNNPK